MNKIRRERKVIYLYKKITESSRIFRTHNFLLLFTLLKNINVWEMYQI